MPLVDTLSNRKIWENETQFYFKNKKTGKIRTVIGILYKVYAVSYQKEYIIYDHDNPFLNSIIVSLVIVDYKGNFNIVNLRENYLLVPQPFTRIEHFNDVKRMKEYHAKTDQCYTYKG